MKRINLGTNTTLWSLDNAIVLTGKFIGLQGFSLELSGCEFFSSMMPSDDGNYLFIIPKNNVDNYNECLYELKVVWSLYGYRFTRIAFNDFILPQNESLVQIAPMEFHPLAIDGIYDIYSLNNLSTAIIFTSLLITSLAILIYLLFKCVHAVDKPQKKPKHHHRAQLSMTDALFDEDRFKFVHY